MAERIRTVRLLDAPDYGTLDIELRYLGNKDMVASAQPMADLSTEEKQRAFLQRFAQHCIKSWSGPPEPSQPGPKPEQSQPGPYTAALGLALLLKLEAADGSALAELINRSSDKAAFGIPRLVDPADLGNE